jgi:hypothetical protein
LSTIHIVRGISIDYWDNFINSGNDCCIDEKFEVEVTIEESVAGHMGSWESDVVTYTIYILSGLFSMEGIFEGEVGNEGGVKAHMG